MKRRERVPDRETGRAVGSPEGFPGVEARHWGFAAYGARPAPGA